MSEEEIATAFLGPLSAYVAAHFWDATTPFDAANNSLYCGPSARRTPRTLCVDMKDPVTPEYEWRLGDVPAVGLDGFEMTWGAGPMAIDAETGSEGSADREVEQEEGGSGVDGMDLQWEGQKRRRVDEAAAVEAGEEPPVDLQPKVNRRGLRPGWQYIVPSLHPDSIQFVSEVTSSDPRGLGVYADYAAGTDPHLFPIDQFIDPLRRFVEGCDRLQGYQFVCDGVGAFGGLARSLMEAVRDDLGNRPIVLAAVHKAPSRVRCPTDRRPQVLDTLNLGYSTLELSGAADAYIPFNIPDWVLPLEPPPLPFLRFNPTKDPVAATAVIAAALDGLLLPPRTTGSGAFGLSSLCRTLVPYRAMRISSLFLALPFPIPSRPDSSIVGALHATPLFAPAFLPLSHVLPPTSTPDAVGQAVVFRARADLPLNPPPPKDRFTHREHLTPAADSQDALEAYCRTCPALRSLAMAVPRSYPLSSAFPSTILSRSLDPNGHFDVQGEVADNMPSLASELPAACHIATTPNIHGALRRLADDFSAAETRLLPMYRRDGDDFREACNGLFCTVDEYTDGACYSDDGDDDLNS